MDNRPTLRGGVRWDILGVVGLLVALIGLAVTVFMYMESLRTRIEEKNATLGGQMFIATADINFKSADLIIEKESRPCAYLFIPTGSIDPRVLVSVNRAGRFDSERADGERIPPAFNVEAQANAATHPRLGKGTVVTVYMDVVPEREGERTEDITGKLALAILQPGAKVSGPVVGQALTGPEYETLQIHHERAHE